MYHKRTSHCLDFTGDDGATQHSVDVLVAIMAILENEDVEGYSNEIMKTPEKNGTAVVAVAQPRAQQQR